MSESSSSGLPASVPEQAPAPASSHGPVRPAEQRTRWARLLHSVLPAPDSHRLVAVADVPRGALPLAEGSLAEAGIPCFVQEIPTLTGQPHFRVLVAAQDRLTASEVVVGY